MEKIAFSIGSLTFWTEECACGISTRDGLGPEGVTICSMLH